MRIQSLNALDQKVARLVTLASRRNQSATITRSGTIATGLQVSIASSLPTQLFDTASSAKLWLRANIRPS